MNERKLRLIIYILGFICLYAFFAIRIFPLMNSVLSEKMDKETRDFNKYGDLYYYNCISHFKQDFPEPLRKYRLSEKNPALNEADILTFGDSFFDFSFIKTFPERLSDTLDQKVYSFFTQDVTQANPICILNNGTYRLTDQHKYAIFETVERNIPIKFSDPYSADCVKKTTRRGLYDWLHGFIFNENSEKLYALLIKRGYIVNRMYSFFATLRFDLCGYISPLTSRYKLEKDPWIFYSAEYSHDPGGFYYNYAEEELNTYADNILHMSKVFKSDYNLELIFMAVPNKYSIYHKMVSDDQYNDFLPRLYAELDERGVHYIDLYTEYVNSPDTLYYGTDTHWNEKGLNKALNLVLEKMGIGNSMALVIDGNQDSNIPSKN